MRKRRSEGTDTSDVVRKRAEDFLSLIYRIVHCSNRPVAIIDFLREILKNACGFLRLRRVGAKDKGIRPLFMLQAD